MSTGSRTELFPREVTRYLTCGPYATVNEAFEFLEACRTDFESGAAAHYAVFVGEDETESGEFAGMAGLSADWDRPPRWGRGSASRSGAGDTRVNAPGR